MSRVKKSRLSGGALVGMAVVGRPQAGGTFTDAEGRTFRVYLASGLRRRDGARPRAQQPGNSSR